MKEVTVPGHALEPERAVRPFDDALARQLRSFEPAGILAILAILFTGNVIVDRLWVVPVGAALVLVWAWRSNTPWRELGFARPRSLVRTIVGGLALGIAFKLVMKALVMPLLGADPVNHVFHFVAANRALVPAMLWASAAAGFGEETVFRGFMFERLGRLLGHGAAAKLFVVVFTAALFAGGHYSLQGLPGVQQAAFTGLVFGSIVAVTGRIWTAMIAHAAFDVTAFAMIYWDLESTIAHAIFR